MAAAAAAVLSSQSCTDDLAVGLTIQELRLNPLTVSLVIGESQDLIATALAQSGVELPAASIPSIAWSSSSPGIADVDGAGVVTGIAIGQATITASAEGHEVQALATVVSPVDITTKTLAAGMVGQPYSRQLQATGGNGTYTWVVTSGSLPPGLTLNPDAGTISGTPTQAGTANFSVTATSGAQTFTQPYSLQIQGTSTALQITTFSPLPAGTAGQLYSQSLQASGGSGSYSWSIVGGALPAGLSLNASSGLLSGTPTNTGTSAFTAQVAAGTETATRALSLTINSVSTGSGPVFTFSAQDYANSLELRAPGLNGEIDNYFISRGTDGSIELLTGQTGVPGGLTNAVELTFFDLSATDQCSQHEPTIALYVDVQEFASTRPREIWWEWDVKFDANWDTQFDCGAFAEHKFMLAQTSTAAGGESRRWDFLEGTGGDHFRMYPSGDTSRDSRLRDPATQAVLDTNNYWDGQWHQYRAHYRMGANNDGAIEAWIDGAKVMEDLNFTTLDGATDYFGPVFKLGANMNLRPNQDQMWYMARFRVWTTDPGW